MKMNEVKVMAREHGINPVRKSKAGLIREIQLAEGNFDCFGTANGFCDQRGCCFRSLCVGKQSIETFGLEGHC
ncbi:MAG TPA: SAP domain-containing protein [Deltaproteobacteria bacterium]|nr:SAP domain-containing protein [Deltaproteobacteria bacterium]